MDMYTTPPRRIQQLYSKAIWDGVEHIRRRGGQERERLVNNLEALGSYTQKWVNLRCDIFHRHPDLAKAVEGSNRTTSKFLTGGVLQFPLDEGEVMRLRSSERGKELLSLLENPCRETAKDLRDGQKAEIDLILRQKTVVEKLGELRSKLERQNQRMEPRRREASNQKNKAKAKELKKSMSANHEELYAIKKMLECL